MSYLDPSHRAVTEIIQFFYEVKNDPNVVARNPNRLNSVVNSWNLLSRLNPQSISPVTSGSLQQFFSVLKTRAVSEQNAIWSKLFSLNNAVAQKEIRNLEFEAIKIHMQKLSQMQQVMSNILNQMHEQSMGVIRNLRG